MIDNFADKIRKQSNFFYRFIYQSYKFAQDKNVFIPPVLAGFFYSERKFRHQFWHLLTNKFYYEPMLRYRCNSVGSNLRTDGDIPLIIGSGKITIGSNVKIGNRGAWILSSNLYEFPELIIGNNTVINYMTQVSVEHRVEIGNNCIIAGECQIFDNNSHSIYYEDRKMTLDDVKPVKIEDYVWIGMRSMILKGVKIGRGSVVAAGSIVTHDVEPMTLVGGNPAKFIKRIV